MKPPSLTIGIEEEYQIIDPATGELKSYITQILDDGKLLLREQIKAEMHQSMVEVGTEICKTPAEARAEPADVARARKTTHRFVASTSPRAAGLLRTCGTQVRCPAIPPQPRYRRGEQRDRLHRAFAAARGAFPA
ncbi:MAG: glutamate-cysteine ligase family protein [Paracoccus sp. (in: a-proteobacteria)]